MPRGLRSVYLGLFEHKDRGFESRSMHGYILTVFYAMLLCVDGGLSWADPLSKEA